MPRRRSLRSTAGYDCAEIAQDGLVGPVAQVHPAQAGLHRQVLLEKFGRRKALGLDVYRVEDQHHAWMVHLSWISASIWPVLPTRPGLTSRP